MKKLYKYASGLFLTGLLSVAVIFTASAQHHMGGGGGSFHSASVGGGGFHSAGINAMRSGITARPLNYGYRRGVVYNRGGFYRPGWGYYAYPYAGFYLSALPFGYYPFYWDNCLYYYDDGVFYTPYDGGGYQVATPPVGAAVPKLPDGAKSIMIDNQQFYELNGVYYKVVVNDQGKKIFVVAGRDGVLNTGNDNDVTVSPQQTSTPQVGDIVNELPDGCRKVILNGDKYYVSPNDIYYQPYVDQDGNVGYRIASVPSPDDDQGSGN